MTVTLKQGSSKNTIKRILDHLKRDLKPNGINAYEFLGKIQLKKDALDLQREMRDEWR